MESFMKEEILDGDERPVSEHKCLLDELFVHINMMQINSLCMLQFNFKNKQCCIGTNWKTTPKLCKPFEDLSLYKNCKK